MQLGKMYLVKNNVFWFLYPTKELARSALNISQSGDYVCAHEKAKTIGITKSCNVYVTEPNTCVVLLNQQKKDLGKVCQLLNSNGNIGWIRCYGFSKHFELVKE